MNDLGVQFGLLAIGAVLTWLIILASQWSRRPRLHVCLDREEVPHQLDVGVDIYERDLVLTVTNVGLGPAVDCVGRLDRLELLQDGEWEDTCFTSADLAWRGTGGARTATIPSDAPPRHLRLLRLSRYFDRPLQGYVSYADPSDAPPVPPDLQTDAGLAGPNRFRFTVWVQPEGEAGVSARCTVEVDWRRSSKGDSKRDHLTIKGDPMCGGPTGWKERAIALLTRRIGA